MILLCGGYQSFCDKFIGDQDMRSQQLHGPFDRIIFLPATRLQNHLTDIAQLAGVKYNNPVVDEMINNIAFNVNKAAQNIAHSACQTSPTALADCSEASSSCCNK